MEKHITKSFIETQKLGQDFALRVLSGQARKILARGSQKTLRRGSLRLHSGQAGQAAVVLALQGDLGAGKTTFLQGFAKGLGIKENVLSPTFIIMKSFKIVRGRVLHNLHHFKNFYHFDCYRLNASEEILHLGFKEIISNPQNIVAIEWPEKISRILPKKIISIKFEHLEENKRELTIND